LKQLELSRAAFYGGLAAVGALGSALLAVAAAIGLIGAAVFGPLVGLTLIVHRTLAAFRSIDLSTAGRSIADGLALGLLRRTSAVFDSIASVGKSAQDAFKDSIDAHSPSKVFEDVGFEIVEQRQLSLREEKAEPTPRDRNRTIDFGRIDIELPEGSDARDIALAVRGAILSRMQALVN